MVSFPGGESGDARINEPEKNTQPTLKKLIRMRNFEVLAQYLLGPGSFITQACKKQREIIQLQRDDVCNVALERLGIAPEKRNVYIKGLVKGDKNICENLHNLVSAKAKELGYTEGAEQKPSHRDFSELNVFLNGSIEDKRFVLQILTDQLTAREIQVGAMKELFSSVSEQDLEIALTNHYETSEVKDPINVPIPIGATSLAKMFFTNEKGQLEVALIHKKDDAPSGSFKIYYFAGTVSALKNVAYLELNTKKKYKQSQQALQSEVGFWKAQMAAKIRHIPALYSHTEKNIFCENYAGGSVGDYLKSPQCTPEEREKLFKLAGLAMLEYLEDLAKNNLVHRDLKPDNLLLSKDRQHIVVADFGCMAEVGQKVKVDVTPGYAAPELSEHVGSNTTSDMYSAAMTLAQIRYNKNPFFGEGDLSLKKNAYYKELDQLDQLLVVPKELDQFDQLLVKMQAENPNDRPPIAEVLEQWRLLM